MRTSDGIVKSAILGYWKMLRIVIVIFFLYLMGDAFFRWDGFNYYAPFSEFIPSLALITALWSILAVCTAFLSWGLLIVLEWLARRIGAKLSIDHLMMTIIFFILFGAIVLKSEEFISSHYEITNQLRFIIVTLIAFILTYLLRNKAMTWMQVIHERITPLVWLFVVVIAISFPLVIYHTWVKQTDVTVSQKDERTTVEGKGRPNILLVIFDTLTSRDMSLYGYNRPTTPFIDSWAKEASVFTRHKSSGSLTTPTTTSLMTGKRLWTHRTFHIDGSKPIRHAVENMPLLLKNNGYSTMAFIANEWASVNVLGVEKSFDIAPNLRQFVRSASLFGRVNDQLYSLFAEKIKLYNWLVLEDFIFYNILKYFSYDEHLTSTPPDKVFKKFLKTIEKDSTKPFFAWVHLLPPHDPYLPPKPFIGMFNSSPMMRTSIVQWRGKQLGLKYKESFQEFPPNVKPAMSMLRDRYDEFIRYCDSQFEEFITSLSESNKLENTIIILSSDHGESFEHGAIMHTGLHLYEQLTHVPLIIKEPGRKEGLIINDLVEQVDIPATILDLAGIQVPSWMEGRSLIPLMRGKGLPKQPAFSMDFRVNPSKKQVTKGTIAMWEDDYKLIHYLNYNKDMLFNLEKDPDELNNLIDSEPEIGRRMLGIIKDNLHKKDTLYRDRPDQKTYGSVAP